jgi:hypothetical protein
MPEDSQDTAIESLRRAQLRLISVTPVRMSLEDYFVAQIKPSEASAGVTA